MKIGCNSHLNSITRESALEDRYLESRSALGLDGPHVFTYTYPLSNPVKIVRELTPQMTAIDLLMFGQEDYQRIYEEEDSALTKPVGRVPGLVNRASTNGPHGIWGHVITDLYFEGIEVADGNVRFSIGS